MLSRAAALAVLPVTLAAAAGLSGGAGTDRAAAGLADDAPRSVRVEHPRPALVTCGDGRLAFAPSALRRPRGYERRRGPLARALRRFAREDAADMGQPRRGWFLLARRGGRAEFAAGRPGLLGHIAFERLGGRWSWHTGGDCIPRTRHYGLAAVTWSRPEGAAAPAPDARRIAVLVQEDACASGDDASGRILRPLVHYGERRVTVTYFIRPRDGLQTCQGVPPTEATLVLDEPLGGRALRDGGPYPPKPRR